MRARLTVFILIVSTAVVLGWCLSAWSNEQKEEKESYKKQTAEKLKTLDKKLDELKAKASEVKSDAKKEFNHDMTELQKKQKVAEKKWTALKKASAKEWEKVKSEMSSAVQDLEGSYDRVVARFKEN
jgi:peptidoglycan hydrolase CwlO-like protein